MKNIVIKKYDNSIINNQDNLKKRETRVNLDNRREYSNEINFNIDLEPKCFYLESPSSNKNSEIKL